MEADQYARTKILFGEALERGGAERVAYLDEACAARSGLRGRVEALLAHAEVDDEFLCGATLDSESLGVGIRDDCSGERVGAYRLVELIGEGGFGSVYLAEQEEPVRRRVALKIIKAGMDTPSLIARFEQERQALAVMQHPNIARILDAGATGAGRPYFVMELVHGDPITGYCDRHELTLSERLALFVQVCRGVQHAHSKGVIHRDIKPSNVLVTGEESGAVARVIDFGVAKVMNRCFTDKAVFTGVRQLVGTLEFMSPEQAEGSLDIDTRTDVYSLGVLLYELLTGVTPFEPSRLQGMGYSELLRLIREEDPARPSVRVSRSGDSLLESAHRRGLEPWALARELRGDLDWIVMRAMEKNRARRYDTASALAADVQRYLAGEVVGAAPPRVVYRARKFVRRHRATVVGAAFVGVALLGGVVGTSIGLMQALHQRDKAVGAEWLAKDRLAEAERSRAEADGARAQAEKSNKVANAVTQFFTQDVLDLRPLPDGTPEPTVRQLLDAVPEKIEKYFAADPAVEGVIRERVGQLYRRLGEIERSREYLESAVPLLERGLGAGHKQTLSAVHRLGELNIDLGRFERAAELFDRAYRGRLREHGIGYNFTMGSLSRRGYARVCAGFVEEGFSDLAEALHHYEMKDGVDSRNAVIMSLTLCDGYLRAGRAAEARGLAGRVLDTILAKQGELAGMEWAARMRLGGAYRLLGELDEAMAQFDQVLEITEQIYPPDHPEFIQIRWERGRTLAALRRHEEARTDLEAAHALATAAFGPRGATCREVADSLAALAAEMGE